MFEIYRGSISREELRDIFLINFNEIRNELVRINFKNIEEFKDKIHIICMKYLQEYSLKSKEYFKSINDIGIYSFIDFELQKYAFKNYWLMKKIGIDYDDFNDVISIHEAYSNYYRDYNKEANKEATYNIKSFRVKFDSFINEEFNPIHENLVLYRENINGSNRRYRIYRDLEKIFIHAVAERKKSPYKIGVKLDIKRYKKILEFVNEFINIKDLTIKDIYYFERIYNINFVFKFYESFNKLRGIKKKLSSEEMINILRGIYDLIYLPNVFDNMKLIEIFIEIYTKYYMNNSVLLQNEVDKISSDLLNYFLPLYNSLYRSILEEYSSINDIKEINNFEKKDYYKLDTIIRNNTIYNIILDDKEEKEEIKRRKEYAYLSDVISSNFEFDKLNRYNLTNSIYDNSFMSKIEEMHKKYRIRLKEFMLDL